MKTFSFVRPFVWPCVLILIFLSAKSSFAEISLTVNPVNGGSSLRFGRVDLQRSTDNEVTIRVNSTDGKQYQVFQRLAAPLVNEQGRSLNRSALLCSGLTGSNAFGSLYINGLENLGFTDQLIYSSDQSGQADSFSVVYKVNPEDITDSGNFLGNIVYSVRSSGESSPGQSILKVYLESVNQSSVEGHGSAGVDEIELRTENQGRPNAAGYFEISHKDNLSGTMRFYQEILEPLNNDLNQEFPLHNILFATSGDCDNSHYSNPAPLERKRVLLCQDQKETGQLIINFRLADAVQDLQVGTYSGRLRFSVESSQGVKNFDVTLRVEVSTIFKLLVEYPPGGMSFSRLIPTDPPQLREILVTVQTNLGRPYAVMQTMTNPLTNEKGQNFQDEFFTFRQAVEQGTGGEFFAADFVTVPGKNVSLYSSNAKGEPVQFKVIYRLRPYESMKPGSYNASITYSLEEK